MSILDSILVVGVVIFNITSLEVVNLSTSRIRFY